MANRLVESIHTGEAGEKLLLAAELTGIAAYLAVSKVVAAAVSVGNSARERFEDQDMLTSYVDHDSNY